MKLCLKTQAKYDKPQEIQVRIEERLPKQMPHKSQLTCSFSVIAQPDYYVLSLEVHGDIETICQRCLGEFIYPYQRQLQLAVCSTEEKAELLMSQFECIVAPNAEINLIEVLTDELHLYLPEKHIQIEDCNPDVVHLFSAVH